MDHHHVSAGSYFVGIRQPLVLEAFLATCVGLALVDEERGVGGLAHFLLPDPVSLSGSFQPEKYASTGLPLFLRSLRETGARHDQLRAVVAGGALIGPVGDVDISLNIGGRTAERVEALLREHAIPVAQMETGGVCACRLSLDMQQWNCRIEPADPIPADDAPAFAPLRPEEVDLALERLQPIPQVAIKLMQLIDGEQECDLRLLTAEIRKDQVISARTLKLANSVSFASRHRIASLDYALMYLGVHLFMRYVIAAAVDGFFEHSPAGGYSLCKGGLYHHAVGAAVIAERLALLTGRAKPALAYTAGLLHDIGKVALDQHLHRAYPLFYRRLSEDQALDFIQAEREVFGVDHTEVGQRLAAKWSLPGSIAESIRHHHAPERAPQHGTLAHIVFLANFLMSCFRAGLQVGPANASLLAPRLNAIGLSAGQFAQLVDMIPINLFNSTPETAIPA